MKNEESCLTHLECTHCGKKVTAAEKQNVCDACGKVLYPRYDLEKAKKTLTKQSIQSRTVYNIWRLHEIMPVNSPQYRVTLGEGGTHVIDLKNMGKKLGLNCLYLKDEGQNPTGTFKSRGIAAAVAKALEFGITDFAMPSAGNAGAALAAYATHGGAKAHVFVPKDTPQFIQKEITCMGGELTLVDGLITVAGQMAKEAEQKNGWFSMSTLKEPYRVEGKKTMGLELAEQFNWTLPDVIVYPTGGGTGIVGMWKAFEELEALGLIGSERPRMISVQPAGCQPIVRAFQNGDEFAKPWENAHSFAGGIRVPSAIGDYLILNAVRASKGMALAVSDSEIKDAMHKLAKLEGIMVCPEAGATVAAVEKLRESNELAPRDRIVLFATGSGLTNPDAW